MLMLESLVNEVKVDAHCCYRELEKQRTERTFTLSFKLILEDTINAVIYHDNI